MAEIKWTVEAEHWLRDIYDYIAQDDPDSAMRVIEKLIGRAEALRQFAALGCLYDELTRAKYASYCTATIESLI